MIKYVDDYVDEVSKKFPKVPKSDIKKILNFGWRSIYMINLFGADTLIRRCNKGSDFVFYIGNLTFNSLKHYTYACRKMATKLRILYNRRKGCYGGYYYVALHRKHVVEYLNQKKQRQKYFTFTDIFTYKLLEECKLSNCDIIVKVPQLFSTGFKNYKAEYKISNFNFIYYRSYKTYIPIENEKKLLKKLASMKDEVKDKCNRLEEIINN